MSYAIRMLLLLCNVVGIFLIIELRQTSQVVFIEIQSLNQQHAIDTQAVNQLNIEYLQAFHQIPEHAKISGLVMPSSLSWK